MKIGILGGTFDPIHITHIKIAQEAQKQLKLDKVFIMPTPYPPHKDKNRITSNFHRANMVKLAVKDVENVFFSDFELSNSNVTYTADTLCMLKELYPENEYYFIVGSDSVVSFMSWYRPDAILKYSHLVVVERDDESSDDMREKVREIEETFHVRVYVMEMKASDISSSNIRCNEYSTIKNMVPESVYEYIVENGLYADENINKAWSIHKITEDLKRRMKPSRFVHTLNVAQTAKRMAETFGVNPNQAYAAGILHDCAKNIKDEEKVAICWENHIEISRTEQKFPDLLHAKVGDLTARTRYGITDEAILSAIRWHTTGKENMTSLEKIIFAADYIEPGRSKQPHLDYLREVSKKDLDLLVYLILKDTLEYLKKDGRKSIDEHTLSAFVFYQDLIGDERKE